MHEKTNDHKSEKRQPVDRSARRQELRAEARTNKRPPESKPQVAAPSLTSPDLTSPTHWPRYIEGKGWSWSALPRTEAPRVPDILPDREHNGDSAQIAYTLCAAYTICGPDGSPVPPVCENHELIACGPDLIWRTVGSEPLRATQASWSGRAVVGQRQTKEGLADKYMRDDARAVTIAPSLPSGWGRGHEDGWLRKREAVLVFGSEAIRATLEGGLDRKKLTPDHGARWGFAWQLPDLTSEPNAPRWEAYLRGMFGGEAESYADTDARIAYLETWGGFALLGVAPSLQLPALILCGAPGTGKSTLARLIASLYPDGAVSQVEPQQWGSKDAAGYHLASLEGKLLNAVYDLDLSAPITDAATLKKVIFGETVNARQIRSEAMSFDPRAAHIWCGNGLPKVVGADPALWARMLPLVVTGQSWRGAPGERRDLSATFAEELPQIVARLLWRAQAALDRAAHGERLLEPPPSSHARLASWRDTADSVALWRSERLTYDAALPATRSITRAAAWQDYQSWCMDTRHQPCSQHEWARRLEAQGIKIKRAGHGGVVLERHNLSAD